jgi:ribosomal peptide maturation radical SAM protein 1
MHPVIPIRMAAADEGAPAFVSTAARARPLRMVLLNLPFASYRRPSIQIGLLGALARGDGHEVELASWNLELAAAMGTVLYDTIAEHRSVALGEWLFAEAAFPGSTPPASLFLERYGDAVGRLLSRARLDGRFDLLRQFREHGAEQFLRTQIARNDWDGVRVFGLTSTFQQNNAVFAMARLLKERYPDAAVVAGGANFDGVMGAAWFEAVPALDYVVSGEGEVALRALLAALAAGARPEGVPNLLGRDLAAPVKASAPYRDLDSLPAPDYDEYFARAERLGLLPPAERRDIDLPVESSRGCWWGERRHCTFCGLNGETMAYRAKSPERVLDELAQLARRYRNYRFSMVDNILDLKFHKTLLPTLAERQYTYNLFYEIKSAASPEKLRELRTAGVVRVQPGIESLSTRVLGLMNKGVKAIANVNLLRWCRILDIDVHWNLIWGFPGETADDYLSQSELVPQLAHLQPALGAGQIWLERFSPLFQERAAEERPLVPEESMKYTYPSGVDLMRVAYFFEYDFDTVVPPEVYAGLAERVEAWRAAWQVPVRPVLEYRSSHGLLQIDDRRDPDNSGIYTFEDEIADLYLGLTDHARCIADLRDASSLAPDRVDDALEQFRQCGLAMRDGDQWLALALPHRPGTRFS